MAEVRIRVEEIDELHAELLEALVAIEQEAFGKGGMNEWFRLLCALRTGLRLWVEGDQRPAGVAECMISWRSPNAFLVRDFHWERMVGQGLGKFLQGIIGRLGSRDFRL